MKTGYEELKIHFDRLLLGRRGSRYYEGLEPIRLTYERAFGTKINFLDVHETPIDIRTNNIGTIITLIGPDSRLEIPSGIIHNNGIISSINLMSDDINYGINDDNIEYYINQVYHAMENVVKMDSFYKSDSIARDNPYLTLIKFYPFYFTYYHIMHCASSYYNKDIFISLLEKYLVNDNENINKLIDNMENSKYSNDPDEIYYTISCGNTLEGMLY